MELGSSTHLKCHTRDKPGSHQGWTGPLHFLSLEGASSGQTSVQMPLGQQNFSAHLRVVDPCHHVIAHIGISHSGSH
jgi:hypothetical protein